MDIYSSDQQPIVISETTSNIQTGSARIMNNLQQFSMASCESYLPNIQHLPTSQQQYFNNWSQNHTNLTHIQSTSYDFDFDYKNNCTQNFISL